jgi:nickel transport protein
MVLFLLIAVIPSAPAQAHKVMVFAYQEGGTVYAEGYFADGKKAQDSLVEVFAANGAKLLEGKTDDNGLFSFPMPDSPEIRIVLTASMGHRAECTLKVSSDAARPSAAKEEASGTIQQGEKAAEAVGEDRIRAIVSEELDRKIAPLAREVALLHQEKGPSLTDIIGGIGYIIGIMGLLMYFKARRRE